MSRMLQNNFSGGVISPSLYGRSDLQAYYKGCAKAENFVVAKEGSLRKRHGITSRLVVGNYDNAKIFPYKFDRTQAGFLLVKELNGGVRIELFSKDCTSLDYEDVASFSGSIKDLQSKQIGDQVWLTNGEWFRVVEIEDGEDIASVTEWKQTPTPDVIPHNDSLTDRSTHWAIARDANRTGKTLGYAAIAVKDSVNSETSKGECKWSSSWVAGTYIDIKLFVKVEDLAKWDYVIIGKRQGSSFGEVTRHYMIDEPDECYDAEMTRIYKWADGTYRTKAEDDEHAEEAVTKSLAYKMFNFRDDNISPGEAVYTQTNVLGEGFTTPLCIDCFQQRRVFANGATEEGKLPMTLWFSEVGNIDNFYADRPTDSSDPFSPTISTTGPAFIRWIVSYDEMLVLFTDSGLFSVGFSQTNGFSAESCRVSRFSDLAVSPSIQPVVTDAGIVFVGADNKTLYTAAYDINENKLKPVNRSVLVEHLTRTSAIKAIALQSAPDNVVWVVTDNGRYATFTFERNEEVFAWSDGFIKDAKILDVIALGSVTDSSSDRTYADLVFVVEKDDVTYIATPNSAYKDVIGGEEENVKATLVTLRPESQERSIVGTTKNIRDILLRVYESGNLSLVPTSGEGLIPMVTTNNNELFTGDVKIMPRGHINENAQMTFVSADNKSCEILQIITTVEING